ncbi:MAG TPA: NADH-quinone oxidoreductase subunit H [Candidatus Rifleibacterium sp.]|mgnify:CR=1 FL=1|nr:NADH-quinone oxidoreductase subunit H [Candidatus Rifleibacterium sp.]
MINNTSILWFILSLFLAPLFPGIINKVKAFFGGKKGPPVTQLYFDLFKLMHKSATYSRTATLLTRLAPFAIFFATIGAGLLMPGFFNPACCTFSGDIIFMAYLLGIARFFMVTAALDRGSAFEGMGASREVLYSALAEPALFCGLLVLIYETGSLSISGIFAELSPGHWQQNPAIMLLIAVSWMIVLLTENARIPVDDPNTHLELTMIHEVMILDYSSKDLAMIEYAAAYKLWLFSGLLVGLVISTPAMPTLLHFPVFAAGMFLVAVLIGMIESTIARMRLIHIPKFIVGSGALAIIALILKIAGN